MGGDEILVESRGRAGFLTLNRPQALNALSYDMFGTLSRALNGWQHQPEVYGIVLDAAGDRAFCAGGDIREVYRRGRENPALAQDFLRLEYNYNWQLETFTKPHISLIDGLVLGGGVGISLYGTHRVAGENYAFGMPETGVGFIPDVGGSWFLGHMPGSIGLYLALTGRSIGRADAYYLGLATHVIDRAHFPAIKQAISEGEPVDALLDGLHADPGEPELKRLRSWIEAVFSAGNVKEIFERAAAIGHETKGWSTQVLEELRLKSPTSLYASLELWRRGRNLNLRRALQLEYQVAASLLERDDFYEGIRATLIDKDKQPRWNPDDIADFGRADVDRLFAARREELQLPERVIG